MASPNDRSSRRPSGGAKGAGPKRGSGSSKGGSSRSSDGRGGSKRGAEGYRERSAASSGGRKSGGAPRKYTKDKPASSGDRSRTQKSGVPSGRNIPDEPIPGNQSWGGLARKGALRATHDEKREYEEAQERALHDDELDEEQLAKRAERERRRVEREARTEALRAEAKTAVQRAERNAAAKPKRPKRAKPALERKPLGKGRSRNEDETTALTRLLGAQEAKKQLRKLRTAVESFESERYTDARKSLKSIADLAPSVPEVRELHGLTLYRMGRFRDAANELEAFRELAGSADQNPVLADCYRAQERWADVAELWEELADASPSADLVSEGRIVMAGSLADQGQIDQAIRLLEKGWKRPAKPQEHHLRRGYALGDLYERSGDLPRARALFDWVAQKAPDFVDVRSRLRNLR